MSISNNRRIARNTLFLYFRMMFTMLVALYTSRVVLKNLGVEDYGVYQSIGGIVGLLSFLNGVLSVGSSRFITFELGRNDYEKLKRTFCTTLTIHIVLALTIAVLAEIVGVWLLNHKLTIPQNRMDAAFWVLQFSVVTCLFTITQIPFNASIIAHERMNVYAYMSIVEVTLKLSIVYLLSLAPYDRLVVYAFLLCVVQCLIALSYRFYCIRHFSESHYRPTFDWAIFKDILGFSGWTVITQLSVALNGQGCTIITNMFFGPGVVTARAISIQVNMAANQFVNNFRTAVNPQIVKKYAAGDNLGSRHLLLNSTMYSFYLMFMLCLPIFLLAEPLLQIWLGQIPPYSVIFLKLIIIQSLFCVFDTSFYTALYAKGRLKENAFISPISGILRFVAVYFLFKYGASPIALSWASLINYALLGLVVKPILIHKIADYPYKEIFTAVRPCFVTAMVSSVIVCGIDVIIRKECGTISHFLLTIIVSVIVTGTTIYFLGLTKATRLKLVTAIRGQLAKHISH